MRPRILPSRLEPSERRLYRSVLAVFVVVFLAMIWPVVTLFSRAEPLVLGLPFFLFYLTVLLLVSFAALLGLYLWEGRHALDEDSEEAP